jgi:predicted metal-dependent hydrolase
MRLTTSLGVSVLKRSLACIFPALRRIQIRNVLNAADVPEAVFVMIVFHEILHLEIPPVRNQRGKWNIHPEEFWEAERQRSPNYSASWEWLQTNIPLRRRPRLQCTDVGAMS